MFSVYDDKPKGYRCPNCGQMLPISRSGVMKCQYCGGEFKTDDGYAPLRIEEVHFRAIEIGCQVQVPEFVFTDNPERAIALSLHEMSKQMAEKLIPLMNLRVDTDPLWLNEGRIKIQGRIKVGIPDMPPQRVLQEALQIKPEQVNAVMAMSMKGVKNEMS